MNVDWRSMGWYEYTMRLSHWNERHAPNEVPAIDAGRARSIFDNASMH